jgi:hypothetical protein
VASPYRGLRGWPVEAGGAQLAVLATAVVGVFVAEASGNTILFYLGALAAPFGVLLLGSAALLRSVGYAALRFLRPLAPPSRRHASRCRAVETRGTSPSATMGRSRPSPRRPSILRRSCPGTLVAVPATAFPTPRYARPARPRTENTRRRFKRCSGTPREAPTAASPRVTPGLRPSATTTRVKTRSIPRRGARRTTMTIRARSDQWERSEWQVRVRTSGGGGMWRVPLFLRVWQGPIHHFLSHPKKDKEGSPSSHSYRDEYGAGLGGGSRTWCRDTRQSTSVSFRKGCTRRLLCATGLTR